MSKIFRSVVCSGKRALSCNQVQSQRFLSSALRRRSFDGKSLLIVNDRMNKSISTEVENKISAFLREEIKVEKENEKKIGDKVGQFEVIKLDGPNVVLKRIIGKEGVTIKFSVNHSLEELYPTMDEQVEQGDQNEPEIVSRPPFVVELDKGGDKIMAFSCNIVEPDLSEEHDEETASEKVFEIDQAMILTKGEEWSDDKVYSVEGNSIDVELSELIKDMLAERGVDRYLVRNLEEWSTSYERKKYIGYLEGLKDYVSK